MRLFCGTSFSFSAAFPDLPLCCLVFSFAIPLPSEFWPSSGRFIPDAETKKSRGTAQQFDILGQRSEAMDTEPYFGGPQAQSFMYCNTYHLTLQPPPKKVGFPHHSPPPPSPGSPGRPLLKARPFIFVRHGETWPLAEGRALSCDGLVEGEPPGDHVLHLSHWQGNRTPERFWTEGGGRWLLPTPPIQV